MKGAEPYPLPKVEDGEDEEPDLKALRHAQTLVATCDLPWASTRTRPKVAFGTGLLGRLAHWRPNYVNTLGKHLPNYLQGTTGYGLNYQPGDDTDYGDGQLPHTTDRLVMYADISYAPPREQYRSIQRVAGQWTGKTLL